MNEHNQVETREQPRFLPGARVRANRYIKNDGTFPETPIGDVLVSKGDLGYVRTVGVFLQRYYIYAVDFVERGRVVGMRARELSPCELDEGVTP